MKLRVDDDELAACVACGLCLPHCPTYRVTGEEAASPRGRIAAMRRVHEGADPDAAFVGFMDACVQCRGCEAACPSSVPFGRLMAGTRESLVASPSTRYLSRWRRLQYRVLGRHRLLLGASTLLALGQRFGLVGDRRGLPPIPLRRGPLAPVVDTDPDVWLFTGCVMDAWQRSTHRAVLRVMAATGARVGVAPLGGGADCCGALHEHAGLGVEAHRLADRSISAFPGDAPIVVDSAGCGAALKAVSDRVLDVHEWLADRLDSLPAARERVPGVVAIQDPCHLRHVQKVHGTVRAVLGPYVERLVELDDEGLCCGAGGEYAALQPAMSVAIRDRKIEAIRRSGATVVASANPGCMIHLARGGVTVSHPLELIDRAIAAPGVQ